MHANITPKDFLNHLFSDRGEDDAIYAGTLYGHNPKALRAKKRGLYTSPTTFTLDDRGKLKRRMSCLRGTYFMVLDDIGTKVQPNDLTPTYKLTSSEGNEQWGYKLDRPYTTAEMLPLYRGVKAAEPALTDPCTCRPNQLVRLPAGINGKKDEDTGEVNDYPVQLIEWNPDVAYRVDDLVQAWGLDTAVVERTAAEVLEEQAQTPGELDPAWIDIVLGLMEDAELNIVGNPEYKDGDVYIGYECPNAQNHTSDSGDKQNMLILRAPTIPGVAPDIQAHCFHTHCNGTFGFDPTEALWARLWPLFCRALARLPESPVTEPENPHNTAAMETVTGVPEKGTAFMRNLVILLSGKYYLIDRNRVVDKSVLDSMYGHQFTKLPSTVARENKHKQFADYAAWHPTADLFLTLGDFSVVNTYRPPQWVPKAANVDLWLKIHRHVWGDYSDLVMQHMAYTIRYPHRKIAWQCLLTGMARTGKTMSLKPLVALMGSAARNIDATLLQTGWGDIYYKTKVLVIEEVWHSDRRFFNSIKTKFANSDVEMLNIKGKAPVVQQNLYAMYMFTNHEDALTFDATEDKLLVVEGPNYKLDPRVYRAFDDLMQAHDADFLSGCLDYLLNQVDLTDFNAGQLPVRTDAMYRMIHASQPDYVHYFWDYLDEGYIAVNGTVKITEAVEFMRARGHTCNRKGLIQALKSADWVPCHGQKKVSGCVQNERFWAPSGLTQGLSAADLYGLRSGRLPAENTH